MTLQQHEFPWTDAWLLASIYAASSGGEPTLAHVIQCGDFLNCALLTRTELNSGLGRLERAGLVVVRDGLFLLTRKGKYKTRIDPKAKRGRMEYLDTVKKRLGAAGAGPRIDPRTPCPTGHVTETDYKNALALISESFRQRNRSRKKNKSGNGKVRR